jgi:hypothetical protein
LKGVLRTQWYELISKLNNISLEESKDEVFWKWTSNKKFSVKSVYNVLTCDDHGISYRRVWKAKIPEKIKIFMWLVEQKAILTKDSMIRRNWNGDPGCYFCGCLETTDHLLFECPVAKVVWGVIALCFQQNNMPSNYEQFWAWIPKALPGGDHVYMIGLSAICWATWKARNVACFEKKMLKSPFDIIFLHVHSFDIGQISTQVTHKELSSKESI